MNLLHQMLELPVFDRLAWTLLHSLWQGALAAALLWLLLRALRRQGANIRYIVACTTLGATVLACGITFYVIPTAGLPVAEQIASTNESIRRDATTKNEVSSLAPDFAPTEPGGVDAASPARILPRETQAISPETHSLFHIPDAVRDRVMGEFAAQLPWLTLLWVIGVLVMSCWNLGGWLAVQQLRILGAQPANEASQRMLRNLCGRMEITRPVRLLQSVMARTPMVVGVLRPMILAPAAAFSDLSIAELEAILAHELAHVRRHDYLVNLLQSLVETLLFYHPAIWWISRQIRAERENCCDDIAVSLMHDRGTYARALASVASVRVPWLAPAAAGGKLLPRLRRILGLPPIYSRPSPRWVAGLLLVTCLGISLVSQLPAATNEQEAKSSKPMPRTDETVDVRGIVLGPDGKPFAGARVVTAMAFPGDRYSGRPYVLSVTRSGSDGRFEIAFTKSAASVFAMDLNRSGADLWKKTNVAASAPELGLAWNEYDKVDSHGDLILRLVPDLPIDGRILDLEGRPVSGVRVIPTGVVSHILTEQSQFSNPPPGYGSIDNPLELMGANDPVVTDGQGRFHFSGFGRDRLVPIRFESTKVALLPIRATTRDRATFTAALGSDKEARLTFYGNKIELNAAPARSVVGVVRDVKTGKPIPGVKISTSYARIQAQTMTDEEGRYRLDGLERDFPVELVAESTIQAYVPSMDKVPTSEGGKPATMDFNLHPGIWITGVVTDQSTGKSVPAEVEYLPMASNKAAQNIQLLRRGLAQNPLYCVTQPNGHFRLTGLPGSGIVAVHAGDALYLSGVGSEQITDRTPAGRINTFRPLFSAQRFNGVRELRLPDNATGATADFQLNRGNTLHLTAVDPNGRPLAVSVRGAGATTINTQSESADGRFDVVGLASNEKRMVYLVNRERKLGKAIVIQLADAPGNRLTVQLEPLAAIKGRLINPEGDPVKSGNIRADAHIDKLRGVYQTMVASQLSEPDGRFTIYLPAGCNYVLGATHSPYGGEYKWIDQNLSVSAGATKDLGDIQVSPVTISN